MSITMNVTLNAPEGKLTHVDWVQMLEGWPAVVTDRFGRKHLTHELYDPAVGEIYLDDDFWVRGDEQSLRVC